MTEPPSVVAGKASAAVWRPLPFELVQTTMVLAVAEVPEDGAWIGLVMSVQMFGWSC